MLIALCSLKGSPGVTTITVAVAAEWPRDAERLVLDADPAGGALALRFGLSVTPGLVSFAAAARRNPDPALLWNHTQTVSGGLRMLTAPSNGRHAQAALRALVAASGGPVLERAARAGRAVLFVDCGRMDTGSAAEAIARRADALVLVAGTEDDELAALAARLPELAAWTPRPALVLSGQGYATGEVERELGVPVLARVPRDPATAATLAGRTPIRRRRAGGLTRVAAAIARALATTTSGQHTSPPLPIGAIPGVPPQHLRYPGTLLPGPPHPAPSQPASPARPGPKNPPPGGNHPATPSAIAAPGPENTNLAERRQQR
ncbi:MinD/ParA family ATP-binding protein [Sciscionella marina]|uniref:MinD/ParA family ATP-binding protein n=1 Tax=Sciscionella marina TaxID=508770 RepID=UPI00037AA722|nr:hypothetical protein [Sciscionella marina]